MCKQNDALGFHYCTNRCNLCNRS